MLNINCNSLLYILLEILYTSLFCLISYIKVLYNFLLQIITINLYYFNKKGNNYQKKIYRISSILLSYSIII